MNLSLVGHSFKYELEKIIRIFLPFEKITFSSEAVIADNCANTVLKSDESQTLLFSELFLNDKHECISQSIDNSNAEFLKECERILAFQLCKCFIKITGYTPKWGILTGVRPAKLFSRLSSQLGDEGARKYFSEKLMVSDGKISLCSEAVKGEEMITSLSRPESFSLYISIPFCPTRCAYCSFVSHSVEHAHKLIPEYVRLLCRELEITAEISKKLNLRLETVYIGGGTPTSISAEQLDRIMKCVSDNFDLSNLREYTVEAGRPDTVTDEKLSVIKRGGATRISINPQSMNDSVLEAIGRKHTALQTKEAFYLARKHGFDNINTDLIAGLPTETLESFKNSVEEVLRLEPESVTVHSLSVKRASNLTVSGSLPEIKTGKIASDMVDFSRQRLTESGILPYYMYRQSKTVGNLENVGYSKNNFECLYNVYIMDETHTILAVGASAVTKLREPNGDKIERIFNYKYPYEYINRFDDLMSRKEGITEFYEKYCKGNKP